MDDVNECLDAKRLPVKPSMLRRCRGWDYRQPCIYQITLTLADRRSNALGRLVIDDLGLPPQAQNRPGDSMGGGKACGLASGPGDPIGKGKAGGLAGRRGDPMGGRLAKNGACKVQGAEGVASSVPGAAAPGLIGHFSAIGNESLLRAPSLLQAQCSRDDFHYRRIPKPGGGQKLARNSAGEPITESATPAFNSKLADLLAAAKHGAVIVSPCISDGEREIARQVFKAGGSVIALRNMGFSPLYKPGGRLFDRAANGKLLLLAPAAWPYQPAEKQMTRFDACALNRIVQLIAGPGAAEINYKGMKPRDIDALVRVAVRCG